MCENKIERVTKQYWDNFDSSQLDQAMEYYILEGNQRLSNKSLLEAELEYAREKRHLTNEPCETLVLLVGFSLEPLLQSMCVYQPQKVVLILNEKDYAGEECHVFAKHVTDAVGYLVEKGLLRQQPQFPGKDGTPGYPTASQPEAIFQTLVAVLHDETNVVIDITGGKKSMVSGAYMYAAYAGTRISYVDFDEYDSERRRPYGYSCKIGELANPYREFALRYWERARALYERYQFREARTVLDEILPTMKRVMPDTEPPIQKLAAFLAYYEHWDRGDYRSAKQAAQSLPDFEQPSAVTRLGDQWFESSGGDFTNKPRHFYGNLPALYAYVCDELARIRRLIDYNEDYRSAFLRAGGVNEIVMLARVVRLVQNPTDRNSLLDPLDERSPNAQDVFKALVDINKTSIDVQRDIRFKDAPRDLSIPRPEPMNPWWRTTSLFNTENGWEIFLNRRNKLTHKYLPVPREWAEDALKFVQANFEDFLGHPMANLGLRTTALPWSELCGLCDIGRFLPPNLRKEA